MFEDKMEVVRYVIGIGILGCFSWFLRKLAREVLWTPYKLQRMLRSQGFKGPNYRPLLGNVPEMLALLKDNNYIANSSQPKPKPIPIQDLSHNILPRLIPYFHKWTKLYGNPILFWFGWKPRIFVTDPEIIKEVILNKFGHFQKIPIRPEVIHLLGKGLLVVEGETWAHRRQIINPYFHTKSLKGMIPAMVESMKVMIGRWEGFVECNKNEVEVEVHHEFQTLTADVISRTAFGSSYKEGKRIFELQREQAIHAAKSKSSLCIPGYRFLPTPSNLRKWSMNEEIKKSILKLIHEREKLVESREVDGFGNDLLGLLMRANKSEAQGNSKDHAISLEDIIDECKTFYFGGYETTSTLITWTMLLLGLHPEWQEKARDEVFQTFGSSTPNAKSINNLKLMGMILNESLRLYPPVITMLRQTYKSMKLGDMILPKGVELVLMILAIHHDSDLWGDDVHMFNPKRFMDGVVGASKAPYAFTPFSRGPRVCIGHNFAMLEAKISLSMILQKFSFVISPSYCHAPTTILTLQPQYGLQLILKPLST